jgi:subtilisin family serine protease
MLRNFIVVFFLLFSLHSTYSQNRAWFYLRAYDTLFQPSFEKFDDQLIYNGNDVKLKSALEKHKIYTFKKTLRHASKKNYNKTFFVISDNESLLDDLLSKVPHIFKSGEIIPEADKKIFEPNDYGLTSTIGENLGFQVNLDYYDFLDLPKAWYYTTGSPEIVIGISDAIVDTSNIEFKYKTKVFKKSGFYDGHGSGVAAIAAAQGDNAYGIPGVCYDCSIYSNYFGDFTLYSEIATLAKAGARVINCSWVGQYHSDNAQARLDTIYKNGSIVVAAAGNKNWIQVDKGKKLYYPASYNHVISVSTVMYKHDAVADNIKLLDGYYFAENIKGYLGRTVGFKDNDTLNPYHIYPVSVTTLNKEVDILAPSAGQFKFSRFIKNGSMDYIASEATSAAAPVVSGTIGLMFSLYPCLPMDEIETILKLTSINIDDIDVNKPYAGTYGSGALNIGNAVEMVFQLYSEKQTAYIQNQNFTRWDFKLTSLSEAVVMRNQKFTEEARLNLRAKNKIIIGKNTVLKPNAKGSLSFKINPSLQKECELRLRDPGIEK